MTSTPDAKRSELARLSNLFDRLAGRPLRENATRPSSEIGQSNEPGSITRGVRTLLGGDDKNPTPRVDMPQTGRTMASMCFGKVDVPKGGLPEDRSTPNEKGQYMLNLAITEEEYAFTFKYKIYKLYKKEEWIKTVTDMLEKSRKNFRPLAETEMPKSPTKGSFHPKGQSAAVLPEYRKRGSVLLKRERTSSKVNSWDAKSCRPLVYTDRYERHQYLWPKESRALGKHCGGVGGSISADPKSMEGEWTSERGGSLYASTRPSVECLETGIVHPHCIESQSPSDSCFSVSEQGSSCSDGTEWPVTPSSPNPQVYGFPGFVGIKNPVHGFPQPQNFLHYHSWRP